MNDREPSLPDATPLLDDPLPARKWIGRWPGVVVSTKDPLKLARVKVRVPQVYGDPTTEAEFIADADLPWARPSLPVHDYHADFEPGDGLWVEFWMGDVSLPIWCGQFLGAGDPPSEFTSSYTPTPKTRILRTTNGHIIEMRWVDGQEKIRLKAASGSSITLFDSPAEGGIKITAETPGLRRLELSDNAALSRVAIETPTQRIEAIDTPTPTVNIIGTGQVNVTGVGLNLVSTGGAASVMNGGGTFTSQFAGNVLYTFLGTLTYLVTGLVALTSAGVITITGGTALQLLTAAGLVSLGLAGAKRKLVDERFFAFFDAHVHPVTSAPGTTGAPAASAVSNATNLQTTNVEAN